LKLIGTLARLDTHPNVFKKVTHMTLDSIQPILDWIRLHPGLAGFAVFLISLSESLAIVGLVVPGVVMMTAIGAMMGSGILPFWETLMWAILGAIAGDGISYWLGYYYHDRLRLVWPFKQFPGLLARGENFFRNHGGKSIIFGRFVGPVRPMIPVIAGMMDMTPNKFLLFNILSAIVWAPLYSLPGILIGSSLGTLPAEAAQRVGLLILILLLALWLFYEFILTIGKWLAKSVEKTLAKLWSLFQNSEHCKGLHSLFHTAVGTEEGQLGFILLFLFSSISFSLILFDTLNDIGVSAYNEPVYQVLRALYNDKAVDFFTLITGLGEPIILLIGTAIVGLWLLSQKRTTAFFCWTVTIGSGYFFTTLTKYFVEMPRPEGLAQLAYDYSFPSGHVFTSTLVYSLTAAMLHNTLAKNQRWIPWAVIMPCLLLVAFSRIYLGMHWFTDILGGFSLAMLFLSLGVFCYRRLEKNPLTLRDLLLPLLIVLIIAMPLYVSVIYPKKRASLVRFWPETSITTKEWWQGKSETMGLYRMGAFKHLTAPFDIQWLGKLDTIKVLLESNGWTPIPNITVNSSLMIFADNPAALKFPILPKFHRDRLPALRMVKELDKQHRVVLQLWHSDFFAEHKIPLWVGSLKIEEAKHPLPFTTVFLEANTEEHKAEKNNLTLLLNSLKGKRPVEFHIMNYYNGKNYRILFINSTT
jgi:membrane protein DedA with SNARE-associated domain